jgi:hypothetical protein
MLVKQYIQLYLLPTAEVLIVHHKTQDYIISKAQTHKNLKNSAATLNTAANYKNSYYAAYYPNH